MGEFMLNDFVIRLHNGNGYFNIESEYGLHLNVDYADYDNNIESYFFDSDYTDDYKYSNELNWSINYLFLEIYNGVRILFGDKPFEPMEKNSHLKTFQNHIEAYSIIDNIQFKKKNQINDSNFISTLELVLNNKSIRDLVILLNRIYKKDENVLVNYYKIIDFYNTYLNLFEKYYYFEKEYLTELRNNKTNLEKYKRITNNYLSIGLVARHGLQNHAATKQKIELDKLLYICIKSIRIIIKLSFTPLFNFDNLLILESINKKTKSNK